MEGCEVRYERNSWNAMGLNGMYIPQSTWINQHRMFLFSATTIGWWGNEEMHEVPCN